MKIKPFKRIKKLYSMFGSTKFCKDFVKALDLGKREDNLDLILAPCKLLPIVGKLAEKAGILPEGKTKLAIAGIMAALPVEVAKSPPPAPIAAPVESTEPDYDDMTY